MARITQLFRSVGSSFVNLIQAEFEAVLADLHASTHDYLRWVLMMAGGFALAIWAVGGFVLLTVALLQLFLPLWGAALTVTVALSLAAGTLIVVAFRKLQQVEHPVEMLQRRVSESKKWLQTLEIELSESEAEMDR